MTASPAATLAKAAKAAEAAAADAWADAKTAETAYKASWALADGKADDAWATSEAAWALAETAVAKADAAWAALAASPAALALVRAALSRSNPAEYLAQVICYHATIEAHSDRKLTTLGKNIARHFFDEGYDVDSAVSDMSGLDSGPAYCFRPIPRRWTR